MKFLTPTTTPHITEDGVVFERQQTIGDDFYQRLEQAKDAFKMRLDGFTHVASIPAVIVDRWYAQGFDINTAPIQDIIARLKAEGMTDLLVSGAKSFRE